MASRSAWIEAWQADLTPSPAARRSAARVEARVRSTRYYGREATARLPQPLPEAENQAQSLPDLKVVTRRRPQWGIVLLALAFAGLLLCAAVIVPVLVSSAATSMESTVGKLEKQQQGLAMDTSDLSAQISAASSPERVTQQAARLGLGPARSVHYLQAGTGLAASKGDTTVARR